jgi:hypothetical protein
MTDSELSVLLDAHDALVHSCVAGELPLAKFLALYNGFPHSYALDGHEATVDERAVFRRFEKRIAFHFRVASLLSGVYSEADSMNPLYEEAGRFAPAVALVRLRGFVGRYPDFRSEPGLRAD